MSAGHSARRFTLTAAQPAPSGRSRSIPAGSKTPTWPASPGRGEQPYRRLTPSAPGTSWPPGPRCRRHSLGPALKRRRSSQPGPTPATPNGPASMNAQGSRFEAGIKRDQLLALHDYAARFFRIQTASSWVPGYLAGRGIDLNVQRRWHVGYAPAGWDTLTRHLRTAGFTDSLLVAGGLARQSQRGVLTDTFRDRAIIPIRSPDGTIIAFIGRAAEHARPDTPKYMNSPATAIYSKGDVMFGLPGARPALDDGAVPVIAEGPLDVMAIAVADRHRYAPVAPCGTALTARQVSALSQACDLRST